jgi:prolyl oligopeptidase
LPYAFFAWGIFFKTVFLMKKIFSVSLLFLASSTFAQLKYPETKKVDQVDEYFGTKVEDPYRWLEDDNSAETKEWVIAENQLTQSYLSQIPYRESIKKRIKDLYNYPRTSTPYRAGSNYYYTKNDGLQNQAVYFYRTGIEGKEQVFLDPLAFSKDGTAAVSIVGFNKKRDKVAISVNQSGSDWQTMYVMDVATRKLLPDSLHWIKFSGAAWAGDGFFYSRYEEPQKGQELSGENQRQRIYYHKLGTPQSKDRLTYEDAAYPKRFLGAQVTDDEQYLIINVSEGTSGAELLVKDLKEKTSTLELKSTQPMVLCKGFDFEFNIVDNIGSDFIVHTNFEAPNYRLVVINFDHPAEVEWKVLVPEGPNLLKSVTTCGDKLFCQYLKDATSQIVQINKNGNIENEIKLPDFGTVSGFSGEKDDKFTFYSLSNFTNPSAIYKYDIASGKSEIWEKSKLAFDPNDFETKQIFFKSKDGTKVPMFIVHKKGLDLNGKNPTLLYGYGGFNIPLTPSFNPSRILLLENDGIFVMANLRGGNEYGEKWHQGGMLENKQNVFDDFIAAAEYLTKNGYTNSENLGIIGRSNGGLLVGACMTQRPDLFKVCFPSVGVLDMLRYHKFTIGWGWAVEYGSSEDPKQFDYLYKYSPLHNIKKTKYPSTLIITADHDDRVVPAHSFKFGATLQANQGGEKPILVRIDTKAGHGAGRSLTKTIDEDADIYSFFFHEIGLKLDEKRILTPPTGVNEVKTKMERLR